MASSGIDKGDDYRYYLHGEEEKNTKWRYGSPPNYEVVNKLFHEGRTKIWPPGSLEERVQNLVKTWEMELFHKTSDADYKSLDSSNYTFSLNGRKGISLAEKRKLGGGYNSLLQTSLPTEFRCYNPAQETVDSSHRAFTTAFPRGFALEILHVYSGPPEIVYKFRHWGYMEGPFKGHAPTGELVELFGMAVFKLNESEKVAGVEFFFDRGELLGGLLKGARLDGSHEEVAPAYPYLRNTVAYNRGILLSLPYNSRVASWSIVYNQIIDPQVHRASLLLSRLMYFINVLVAYCYYKCKIGIQCVVNLMGISASAPFQEFETYILS